MKKTEKSSSALAMVWKNPVFWFAIALGLTDGSIRNFVPATFPVFSRELGASLKQMGDTQFLFYVSSLIFAAIGGPTLALTGLNRGAVIALGMAGTSLLLIGFTREFAIVLIATGMLGLAIVALVVITSSIITRHFPERRQSVFLLSGLSDASGSMLGPAFMGWWIVNSSRWDLTWRSGYLIGAAVLGVLLVWALFIGSDRSAPMTSIEQQKGMPGTREVLCNTAFYVAVALCFCHGLAQAGMVSFVGQLYVKKIQVDAARAAYLLSIEAVGILSGRLIFGAILARWGVPELLVIAFCASAETAAFVATIVSSSYLIGAATFLVGGFFMAAVGPSLNSYLGGRFATHAATAFALFAGIGNLGAALGPYLIGRIGADLGIEYGIFLAPLFGALLSSIALLWHIRERRFAAATLGEAA
jgi:MFS family permease